ncbi:putative 4-coumarate--CoA ligase [Gordonia hirsuta DSM 44140 = NBRC 16056]|uniref:Putative 4-coumarate--CoA ligase n=1 Tax=Gordonia hirsuta DSM 44140 = NBRC 16056 TaxID=1121927 RepID=L7L6U9_9ACTN|nr:AMP-binding protein [Gordonia hirsuta]GAC56875.1 putative 4-coumarate--CoA ligase [Gordonia hirsuta DSM 44140 = NBRC 16056]
MSFRNPYDDVEIPDVSVYDFLFGSIADGDLDRTALIDSRNGATTTYRQLIGSIDAAAGALAARGIGVGDVVAVLSPNIPAFATVFHGILRAGATATTLNALFTANEIRKQLVDAKAKMLVTISMMAPQALEAAREVGIADENIIILDGEGQAASGHPNAADLLGAGLPAPEVEFDPATHIAVLPYSSGTTGNPKGVMLSHRNLVANVAQIEPINGMVSDDVVLAVLPFFHIYGMTVLLNAALKARASLVVMPRFDMVEFLESVQTHKITYAFIAPPVAVALAKHPIVDKFDLSSIHTMVSGAAPLDEELGNAVAKRLGLTMLQGFGMSELSPVSHLIPFDGGEKTRGVRAPLASVGWAVPNTENRIVDPGTGADVEIPAEGVSEPGELWVKGPNVMVGYLNNDAATAETIVEGGWLRTGDMATVDATGCVTIVDRLKELIKYKGYQVPPAELEALLLTNPKIADVAVVGAHDEDGEEVPKAFVVVAEGAELTADEVMEFTAERVAPYKKVRQVEFIDAVPKSASGKILRKDLRK